jgi:hypothetical protein
VSRFDSSGGRVKIQPFADPQNHYNSQIIEENDEVDDSQPDHPIN